MLRHAVHARLPAVFSCLQTVVTLVSVKSFLLVAWVLAGLLLSGLAGLAGPAASFSKVHVGKANSIIQVQMGGKVPPAVVGIFSTNVIGMEGQKSLVWRHAGGTRIEQSHEMIVHVAHAVTLEAELSGQVQEDILDLLLCARNLSLSSPSWVRLARPLPSRKGVRVVHAVYRS